MIIKITARSAALCVALISCGHALAATLTVSHGYPPNHTIAQQGIDPWMECVASGTEGEIDFKYYPSGQVAAVKDSYDAIKGGISHVSTVVVPYLSHLLPLNGLTMLPDMGDTSEEMVTAYRGILNDGGPLLDEWEAIGVRPLVINMLPVFQMVSTRGPIDTLEKFKGQKIRSAGGLLNFTINALGATAVEMAAGDMYVAMQRGTLDGTFSALASVQPYSLDELTKAVSTNGKFGGGATIIGIDKEVWQDLPGNHQVIIDECGAKTEAQFASYLDAENIKLQHMFQSEGIQVYEFSPEERSRIDERLNKVSEDYITRLEKRGMPAERVYARYREILNKQL